MNTRSFIKKASLAIAGVVAGLAASTAVVSAIPYDAAQTNSTPVPTFNAFTGVPSYGDESDFLRSREVKAETTSYVDPLAAACNNGDKIQMRVYVHNGASKDANNNGSGPSVAKDVRVKVNLPAAAAASFNPTATISASNAATVNDSATINCNGKNVKLKYVAGSAAQSSIGTGRVALADSIVSTGVPIRSQAADGAVYGCWDERVYVILTVEVVEEPKEEPKVVSAICELFKITTGDNRTIRVSEFKYASTNAAYKSTVLNWDAGKTNVSTAAITDGNKVVGQTYKYAADGTYLITATVRFTSHDNKEVVAPVANCQQQVTFTNKNEPVVVTTTTPVTPATPAKPVALVAAGPASTIATFVAIAALAGGVYHYNLRRRTV